MFTVLLPPGVNKTAVKNISISVSMTYTWCISRL